MLRGGRLINLLKKNRDDLVVGIQNYLFVLQREFIISPDSHIIDIFNSDEIGHKLLITGELGSRKTITLIELAYFLIAQAKQDKDKAILVLFKLSHWKGSSMSFFVGHKLLITGELGSRKTIKLIELA
ncbi:MAG: hypothetical protein O4749_01715 [Trichodesmium sp. St5_bin2_1]|nr:hypothetical protein [Trichodesmium sp. St5_bin2_1]